MIKNSKILIFFTLILNIINIQTLNSNSVNDLIIKTIKFLHHNRETNSNIIFIYPCITKGEFGEDKNISDILSSLRKSQYFSSHISSQTCLNSIKNALIRNIIAENQRIPLEIFMIFKNIDELSNGIQMISTLEKAVKARNDLMRKTPEFFLFAMNFIDNNQMLIEFLKAQESRLPNLLIDSDVYFPIFNPGGFMDLAFIEIYSLGMEQFQINQIESRHFGHKFKSRGNLRGIILRITVPEPRLIEEIEFEQDETGQNKMISGMGFKFLKDSEETLNFTLSINYTNDCAVRDKDGVWGGIAKEVREGRADLAYALTNFYTYRAANFTFLQPTFHQFIYIFFRQPSQTEIRDIFFDVFQIDMWISLFVMWIVFFAIIHLFKTTQNSDQFLIDEAWIWSTSAICQKGYHKKPQSAKYRIIFLFANLFALIVYSFYGAALVSNFSRNTLPINSFDDLLNTNLLIAVDIESSGAKAIVLDNPEMVEKNRMQMRQVRDRMAKRSNVYIYCKEALGEIIEWKSYFISYQHTFFLAAKKSKKYSDNDICYKFSHFQMTKYPNSKGYFIPKNSPYKEFLNSRVSRFHQSGLLKLYQKGFKDLYLPNCGNQNTEIVLLSLNDVFTAFALLLSGLVLSLIILFIENMYRFIVFMPRVKKPGPY